MVIIFKFSNYRIFKLVIPLLLVLTGCENQSYLSGGDYFFLKNKGAVMPVWVRGNQESGVMLITVHGGPGGTGHAFVLSEAFRELEKDYAVLYWDQRFSGLSGGDPDKSTLTIDQFIEDLSQIVQLAHYKYPDKKLFILGHSWGGGLSAAYLGRENNQSLFRGWIDVDGSVKDDIEEQEIRRWILERVPSHYDEDPAFWQFIIDWYNEHPEPVYSDEEPYLYVSALGGDAVAERNYPVSGLVFRSPFSLALYSNKVDQAMCDGIDFTAELNRITLPSLILWGREDGILPDTLADYTFNQLGTNVNDKQIVKIMNAAHSPQFDNPAEFSGSVKKFINRYK
jgi:pimeloyl-ACP methyl ester carboxylesterase